MVIIGTDDEPSFAVVVIRVNGATASKSCALVKLMVTRLLFALLVESSRVLVVGTDLKSVFDRFIVLILFVVMGKRVAFVQA